MIKRKIDNSEFLKIQKTIQQDGLTSFILADGTLRAVLCSGTDMINQMRANHQLQIAETLILGQNYIAASLLSANLKEEDILRIKINCSGPLGGLNVETDHKHHVRGYLSNNPIKVLKPGTMSMSDFFGAGILSITRSNRLTNKPFTGQIELQYGNSASDLAYYFTTSEQLSTSFNLDISFSDNGNVNGAGGLLIQAMPGVEETLLIDVEKTVRSLPSIGKWFAQENSSEDFISRYFGELQPKILNEEKTSFFCSCNKEMIEVHISALPEEDKLDIINKNEFPIKTLCHNCGTSYNYSREESIELLKKQKNIQ